MTLKPCPECKAQISAGADVCTQCGFSFKKQARSRAQIGCAVFVIGFIALAAVIGSSSNDTKSKSEQTSSTQGGVKEQSDKLPRIGEMAGLSMSSPGSLNEEATSKIKSLLREHDPIAAGKIGKVEHVSVWNGNTCLRFQGEPDCLWFPSVFVTSVSELVASAISAQENEKPRSAESSECKKITARLIKATGAQFERISPLGDNVFLKHPIDKEMVLSCTTHRLTGISLNWDGASPSNEWFALAAKAGNAVTGEDLKKLDVGIRECHRSALKGKSEVSDLEVAGAKIECQAFTRDGGGTLMSIGINDHEARQGVEEP
ncbi:MAG: hypothetical protein ABSD90_12115 [Methylocystis sp.]|jgi:hypothetical protein